MTRLAGRMVAALIGGPVRAVAWGAATMGATGWLVSWWVTLAIVGACLGYAWWWSRRLPQRWWLGP